MRDTVVAGAIVAGLAALPAIPREASTGWDRYVTAAEWRRQSELQPAGRFLATDYTAAAEATRARLRAGETVIASVVERDRRGQPVVVPSALVHHWRGAVLVGGARLGPLLSALESGVAGWRQEGVVESRVLGRAPGRLWVFLRVEQRQIIRVVFNTEHAVSFRRYGPGRAASSSAATRIVEVSSPGSAAERERASADDRGLLQRWHAYWRYLEVAEGVIAECESISLSRPIPPLVEYLARPLIDRTATDSMARTLASLRTRFETRVTPRTPHAAWPAR